MQNSFLKWNRMYNFERNIVYLCAKSIIIVKNQIMQKYFDILDKNCQNNK